MGRSRLPQLHGVDGIPSGFGRLGDGFQRPRAGSREPFPLTARPAFELGSPLEEEALEEWSAVDDEGALRIGPVERPLEGHDVRVHTARIQAQLLAVGQQGLMTEPLPQNVDRDLEEVAGACVRALRPEHRREAFPGGAAVARAGEEREQREPVALSGPAGHGTPSSVSIIGLPKSVRWNMREELAGLSGAATAHRPGRGAGAPSNLMREQRSVDEFAAVHPGDTGGSPCSPSVEEARRIRRVTADGLRRPIPLR